MNQIRRPDPEGLVGQARTTLEAGRPAVALYLLDALAAPGEASIEAEILRARACIAHDRPQAALETLDHAIARHPANVEAFLWRARAAVAGDQAPRALGDAGTANALAPGNIICAGLYATLLLEFGLHHQAIEVLERAIAISGQDSALAAVLALARRVQNDAEAVSRFSCHAAQT